jgi:hypothetical protein
VTTLAKGVRQPKIYVYTTPQFQHSEWKGPRDGRGLLKVGFTERDDVHQRIREQLNAIKLPESAAYDLLLVESAFTDDGSAFLDHAVHAALVQMGIHRLPGKEWFEATIEEISAAIHSIKTDSAPIPQLPRATFQPRPEQLKAVEQTAQYFTTASAAGHAPHFLWNAKMRFGKTFTTYQLAKRMGWTRILVLTYKPAVEHSWRSDLLGHEDFLGWRFKGKTDPVPELKDVAPLVWFASFQDVLGTNENGEPKTKNLGLYGLTWDIIVVDEYHFGAWGEVARDLYAIDKDLGLEGDPSEREELEKEAFPEGFVEQFEKRQDLKSRHFLYLSGTPFRAIAQGEFLENQIFNWTYSDEQREKREWSGPDENPYLGLPMMHILTYEMPEKLKNQATNNKAEFSLTEFFRTRTEAGKTSFVHANEVQQWLDVLRGQGAELYPGMSDRESPPFPYKEVNLREALRHTIWYLPSVAATTAMYDLLTARHNQFFHDYQIIKAAGKQAKIGALALPPVEAAIGKKPQETKSITLTCGKLLTGVTVPAWTGIFMLRELKRPETYFQAAFRVQSPWVARVVDPEKGGKKSIVLKDHCYVFDFAPNRALSQVVEYALNLGSQNNGRTDREAAIRDLLDFMPVLAFEGQSMNPLNAEKLIDYLTHGITSSMLARRWNSPELIRLDLAAMEAILANTDLVASLQEVDDFRALNDQLVAIIAKNNELAPKLHAKEKLDPGDRKKQDDEKRQRNDLKQKLRKFVSRLPVFMYLTDNRERSVMDLVTVVEPGLFQTVTQLKVEDFQMLLDAGVFDEVKMDDAVWKFREYERPSLGYGLEADPVREEAELLGGFSVSRNQRFATLISSAKISEGDILYPADTRWQITGQVANYGILVNGIRYSDPSDAAKSATNGALVDGWKFWSVMTSRGLKSINDL